MKPLHDLVRRRGARLNKVASAVVLLMVIVLLAACGAAQEDEDGTASGWSCPEPDPRVEVTSTELNLFVWTEYIPDEMIDCFEEKYDVKVNRDEFSSNEEMYAKLSAGNTSYDLAQPTDQIVELMVRQGLLEKLDPTLLHALDNFNPDFLAQPFDPNNEYTIPYQAGVDAIVVNTAVVENIPTAFADLWNEEYAGRMVMVDDARTIIGATLLTLGYDPNTTDPAEIEAAGVKLAELVAGVKIFDSDSPKTALIAGDADLGIVWTGEAKQAADEVESIEFVYPSEGAIVWQDNWAVPAGAPHMDAAYAWMNYINQPDIFWTTMRDFPYLNPNAASIEWAQENEPELYSAYMDSTITNVPSEVLANGVRITDVGDATIIYDRIWTEVKAQ